LGVLLDTNVISEFQKPKPDGNVVAWLDALDEEQTFISVVTIGELRRGIALLPPSKKRKQLDHWLHDELLRRFEGRTVDITSEIAEVWGDVLAQAKRKGVGLHVMDAFILASARVRELKIATRNSKDFEAFDAELINPWQIEPQPKSPEPT
jgi:toxin FitB